MNQTSPPPISSPAWSDRTKRTVLLLGIAGATLLVIRLHDMLPLLLGAVVLAYLMTPVMLFIERRLLAHGPLKKNPPRSIAILLSLVVLLSFFVIVSLVVLPVIIDQFNEFARSLPNLLQSAARTLERALSEPLTFNGEPILIDGEPFIPLDQLAQITGSRDLSSALQEIDLIGAMQSLLGSLPNLGGQAFNVLGGALTVLVNLLFLVTMLVYLMKDGGKFSERLIGVTPYSYRNDVRRLLYELSKVWDAYLRGQLILCFVMGFAAFTAASILGLPNAVILGLLVGVLEFIPGIGPAIALVPAVLLALFNSSSTLPFLEAGAGFALVVAVVWTSLQQLETMFLVPRIMGNSLNLHPFVVIVGVIAGASLAGLLGILLAAPVVASLRVLGQYVYGKLTDQNPFPSPKPRTAADRSRIYRMGRGVAQWVQQRTRGDGMAQDAGASG